MPTCGNCQQEVEFYEHGGLFYCKECNTQSQVMRVIEKDNDFEANLDYSRSYSISKGQRKREELEDVNDPIKEKSWWSCEIYQAILKSQVKALIAMGFPTKLDEIVMQLWFHYLSKSGVAFCKAGTAHSSAKRQLDDTDDKDIEEEEDAQNMTFSPSTPSTARKYSETKVLSRDDFLHRSERGDIVRNRSRKSRKDRIRLCLWDSVCLVYVGLRLMDEPVLLSDMLRWVRQGHLPIRSTSEVLPEHIGRNLSSVDIDRFCNPSMYMPDVNSVLDLFHQLLAKLDIKLRPLSQRDMSMTIARMILSLNLPVELCNYTHRLYCKVQPAFDKSLIKGKALVLECQALAYIIVALKLLFVLNDDVEHAVSSKTRRLQTLFSKGVRLFNWDVWVEAHKLRGRHILGLDRSVQNLSDFKKVSNMPAFVQHFSNFYRVEEVYRFMHMMPHDNIGRQERLKEYQRPFRALSKELSSAPGPEPSSFATTRSCPQPNSNDQEDHRNASLEERNDVRRPSTDPEWLPRDYLLNEDFSKHTLKHLTNLQELCERYVVPPESVRTVLDFAGQDETVSKSKVSKKSKKSKKSKNSKKDSSSTEGPDDNTSSGSRKRSANCEKKPSHKKHKSRGKLHPSDDETQRASSKEAADEGVKTGSSEWPVGMRLNSPAVPYETYPTISTLMLLSQMKLEDQMDSYHTSMEWLLDLCSKMWEMKSKRLISFSVHNVERVLFKL